MDGCTSLMIVNEMLSSLLLLTEYVGINATLGVSGTERLIRLFTLSIILASSHACM